jgi:hypothetical protein
MRSLFLVLVAMLALIAFTAPVPAFAQDGPTATVTVDGVTTDAPVVADPFPGVSMEMAFALVTMLAPFVTWGFKWLAVKAGALIPKFLMPVIAGGISLLLTWLVSAQAGADIAWYMYVLLALAGVGLREFNDRIIVKPVQALRAPKTVTDTGEIG